MLGKDRVMPHHPGEVGGQKGHAEVVMDPDSAAPEAGAETEDGGRDQEEEDGDGETSHRDLIDCHPEKIR